MIHVLTMDVSHMEEETFIRLCRRLDDGRLAKVNACKRYEDKVRSLGCGLLLHAGLRLMGRDRGAEGSVAAEKKELRLGVKEKGKPCLIDFPDIFFNLSHSGKIAALAIGDREVGLDVQEKEPVGQALARKVLSEREYEKYMTCMSEKEQKDWFFRCWCAKESMVKMSGEGLFRELAELEYRPWENRIWERTKGDSYFVRQIPIEEGYIMMVCTEKETDMVLETDYEI